MTDLAFAKYVHLIAHAVAKPRPKQDAPRHCKKFTEEEKRAACEQVKQGIPRHVVASRLGVYVDTLSKWATQYGIQKVTLKHDPETIAEAKRLQAKGMSHRQIGEALNVPKSTVTMWMTKHAN